MWAWRTPSAVDEPGSQPGSQLLAGSVALIADRSTTILAGAPGGESCRVGIVRRGDLNNLTPKSQVIVRRPTSVSLGTDFLEAGFPLVCITPGAAKTVTLSQSSMFDA